MACNQTKQFLLLTQHRRKLVYFHEDESKQELATIVLTDEERKMLEECL